jgi:hypothetical protein
MQPSCEGSFRLARGSARYIRSESFGDTEDQGRVRTGLASLQQSAGVPQHDRTRLRAGPILRIV